MSKTVERTITVDKPLARVWEYLSDFTTTTEWDPGTVRTTRTAGNGDVGTTYHNVSKFAGREVELTYTVADYDPQQQITLIGENSSIRTVDTMRFSGDATRSEVVYTATFAPKGVLRLTEPLLPLGMKKIADATQDSLQEHLEKL
jgi:uncharacterized protein YndB with AHSA1/START domain